MKILYLHHNMASIRFFKILYIEKLITFNKNILMNMLIMKTLKKKQYIIKSSK